MSSKAIGIIILIVAAVAALLAFRSKGPSSSGVTPSDNTAGSYSIKEIMAMGKDMQCSLKREDQDSKVSGTILISGDNVRGDFEIETSQAEAAAFVSHFIVTGGTSYTWTSLANIGYKAPVEENSGSQSGGIVSLNNKADYSCYPWQKENDMFKVPTGINFRELGQ